MRTYAFMITAALGLALAAGSARAAGNAGAGGGDVSKHVDTLGSGTALESEQLPGTSAVGSVRLPDGLVLAGRKPGASSGTGL